MMRVVRMVSSRKPKTSKDSANTLSAGLLPNADYAQWFSNHLAKEYAGSLPYSFKKVNLGEKREIYQEALGMVALYSLLVYRYYPENETFRKEVDSSQELKANFGLIKAWLDKNDGKTIADQFISSLESVLISAQTGAV